MGAVIMGDEREILEERARELARVPEENFWQEKGLEVVAFRLGEREFAVGLEHVQEVKPFASITPLPGLPAFVLGITGIRGEIFSVVDISHLLGVSLDAPTADARLIILQDSASDMTFAVPVNSLIGTSRVALDKLLPVAVSQESPAGRIIMGVTDSGMVVLDGKAILNEPSLRV